MILIERKPDRSMGGLYTVLADEWFWALLLIDNEISSSLLQKQRSEDPLFWRWVEPSQEVETYALDMYRSTCKSTYKLILKAIGLTSISVSYFDYILAFYKET